MLVQLSRKPAGRGVRTVVRAVLGLVMTASTALAAFTTFESGQVRPLALSPTAPGSSPSTRPTTGSRSSPSTAPASPHTGSVPVGLEPVAVAARTNTEVWVVNHLSDSVSIVDVAADAAARRPHAAGRRRAARHRLRRAGRHPRLHHHRAPRPEPSRRSAATCTTRPASAAPTSGCSTPPASAPTLGGTPLTIVDALRRHAARARRRARTAPPSTPPSSTPATRPPRSPRGGVQRRRGRRAVHRLRRPAMPGGLPPARTPNFAGRHRQPEVGLIVKFDDATGHWEDELGRNWDNARALQLPDLDVFAIDANAGPPAQTASLRARRHRPLQHGGEPGRAGRSTSRNTDAHNEVRFEGPGHVRRQHACAATCTRRASRCSTARTVTAAPSEQAHQLRRRCPSPAGDEGDRASRRRRGMAVTANGRRSTSRPSARARSASSTPRSSRPTPSRPTAANHIGVSGGGPSGLVLDEATQPALRADPLRRRASRSSTPTTDDRDRAPSRCTTRSRPRSSNGRPFLYDAALTSSNGEASCASCHIFGDFDSLAWDLGNPDDVVLNNPNPIRLRRRQPATSTR